MAGGAVVAGVGGRVVAGVGGVVGAGFVGRGVVGGGVVGVVVVDGTGSTVEVVVDVVGAVVAGTPASIAA